MKRLKPIRNYLTVYEPFDPHVDPAAPPKKNYISNINERANSKLFDLSRSSNNVNNKNLTKKEKEIYKTILINNLLKSKRKLGKESINKNKKLEEDNDDALVIHYVNSDEDSSRNQKNKRYNYIGYNSESESERYKQKLKKSLSKKNNIKNKIYNFKMDEDDCSSNNNKTSSLEDNNSLEKKIFHRNDKNNDLYDIYIKDKFSSREIKKTQ